MMTLIMDGQEYRSETAVGLIEQIKGMHWQVGENATPEEYIVAQERTYRKMTGHKLKLPRGSTENRAKAMFETVAGTGAWTFKEGECV